MSKTICKLDHVYLSVKNLDRAIKFYEALLDVKVTNRFENRWADFQKGGEFYLGLYNPTYDKMRAKYGNNCTIGLYTTDIKKEHKRVKSLNPKNITKVLFVNFFMPYKFFQFADTEGNVLEVAQYKK